MGRLSNLEPREVFRFFEEISQIPRPSYKEKMISDYLVQFAKDRNLEYYQDDIYNVIIIKEASEGYEDQEPIILQGHMDMVCEKAPDCTKDMDREGLDLAVEGDFVYARGTTLGGDDGIAVAYALALLDSDSLRHPRLEFVCTVSEETGMDGAHAIDCSPLKGHLLLNMDSEKEGIVLAGCAGGGRADLVLAVNREPCSWERVQIAISGLRGGHSGVEIHKGRADSVSLMARILREANARMGIRLLSAANGSKDNAISREARFIVAAENPLGLEELLKDLESDVRKEYALADPDISFVRELPTEICGVPVDFNPLTEEYTARMIGLLSSLPMGVQRMSDHVAGLVETSLNWGVADLDRYSLTLRSAVRSSVGTAFEDLIGRISCIARAFSAEVDIHGVYPAWEWVQESLLRDKMSSIYQEMFGRDLVIEAIHAGVECGLLAGKIKNLDAVSMGPDILDIHTPQERLSISSTARMYDYIVRVIESRD